MEIVTLKFLVHGVMDRFEVCISSDELFGETNVEIHIEMVGEWPDI